MLDASTTPTVAAPGAVSEDTAALERRRNELGDPAVATVGKNAAVPLAEVLDLRATIVHRIVAIAGTTGDRSDDPEIASTREDLRVARPAVVLGPRSSRMVACRNERAVHDPGIASIVTRRYGHE